MLKIKDNVDLKELEKFGFIEGKYSWDKDRLRHKDWDTNISINTKVGTKDYKRIYFKIQHSGFTKKFDLIFDLIQAGLVEKVEQ